MASWFFGGMWKLKAAMPLTAVRFSNPPLTTTITLFMIIEYSIIVFVTQLIFIGCRTWNVKAIADKNIAQVLISGAIVHITWLISISIGAISMNEIISNFEWAYLPIIICSLTGGLIGSYVSMKSKKI